MIFPVKYNTISDDPALLPTHREGKGRDRKIMEAKLIKQSKILLLLTALMLFLSTAIFCDPGFAATKAKNKHKKNKKIISYSIQTGVYSNKKNADSMLSVLRAKGYEPYIYKTLNSKGHRLYVVRIGNFHSINQATFAAAQFRTLEKMPAVITKTNSARPLKLGQNLTAGNSSGNVISSTELARIDGRSGTLINSDELAKIDGQSGTVMPPGELSQIDGQSGTVISPDELATVSAQTGTLMPSDELATVDGQAKTRIQTDDMAKVNGQKAPSNTRNDTVIATNMNSIGNNAEPSFLSQSSDSETFIEEDNQGNADSNENLSGPAAKQLKDQIDQLQEKVDQLREEADVRKILEITQDEKQKEDKEILSATGRDYTLSKKGYIGFDYSASYTYNSYDSLEDTATLAKIEHQSSHNLTNSLSVIYAVRDNVTINASVPFVYAYDSQGTDTSKDVTDLGDINLSLQWQPIKAGGKLPPGILSFGFSWASGRSPYEINPEEELSTGAGYNSTSVGLSLSNKLDPIMVYGGLSYNHSFSVDKLDHKRYGASLLEVNPSDSLSARLGFGYAISYKLNVNLNLSYSYSYGGEYVYNFGKQPIQDSISSSFSLGTGWRLSAKRSISVNLSKGLTNDAPDFSISFRMPFSF